MMEGFEKRLLRLEEIAEKMRDREVPLEEVMTLFDEGSSISRDLEEELQGYERKVYQLVNSPETNGGGTPEIEPYPRE